MPPVGPSMDVFLAYKGAHAHQLWARVGPDWICPCCKRTKYQLMRWTKRAPNTPQQYMDWLAVLHTHHDHSVPLFERRPRRFDETVICDQCNVADGQAKRKLGLGDDFSFSPYEIAQFITATPHGRHKYDFAVARRLYEATLFGS